MAASITVLSPASSEANRLTQRLQHAAFSCDSFSRDVERRAVIDRRTDHRQADRNIYAGASSVKSAAILLK